MQKFILVTGATGTVGRELVKILLEKQLKIKVGVRSITKTKSEAWANQVELVLFDYEKPETLKSAFKDVTKLFLVTPPGTFREKEVADTILTQGIKQNLNQIVRLSGLGADEHDLFANHQAADTLLLSSEIDFTALRPNSFMQNFYNYLPSIKEQHKIFEPAANGKTSFIDARDIAAVAATILTGTNHKNKIYELTGGESLDYYQVAELFSDILGFNINYEPLTIPEYIKAKEAEGMPPAFSERFAQFFFLVQKGDYAAISPMVEKILGRPPIKLEQFIRDYRFKFINENTR